MVPDSLQALSSSTAGFPSINGKLSHLLRLQTESVVGLRWVQPDAWQLKAQLLCAPKGSE